MALKNLILFTFTFWLMHLKGKAQIVGCTDPAANNFNATATINNCNCTYNNAQVNPTTKFECNTTLNEISGQILIGNKLYAINDGGGAAALYELDTINNMGNILRTINITNATNIDWEDITQDDNYIYIGDFGNNVNGARTDLKIYKLNKTTVLNSTNVIAEIINFNYSDQATIITTAANSSNFDCEAIIAKDDSLYLFSKNWVDKKTKLYKLPKTAGTHTATFISDWDLQSLVTGATIINNGAAILLTAYDALGNETIGLLYGYTNNNFLSCTKRLITLNEGLFNFHQIEGICNVDNNKFFISNELRTTPYPFIGNVTTLPKIREIDLTTFLQPYYSILAFSNNIPINLTRLNCNTLQIKTTLFKQLNYKTAIIETSLDGLHFKPIQQLNNFDANNGNIILPLSKGDAIFLRLKVININNEITYSLVSIIPQFSNCNKTNHFSLVSTSSILNIQLDGNGNNFNAFNIYNTKGQIILNGILQNEHTTINIAQLPKGLYIFKLMDTNNTNPIKFIKQ